MEKILVAEDERDIQELLEYNLKQEGYESILVGRGDQVVEAVEKNAPSLVLLDLMLPGMSGIDICKKLRGNPKTRRIPMIMVTAKGAESDKIVGLEIGADDYITKPFSPKEVMARVKALLRRANSIPAKEDILSIGGVRVDSLAFRAFSGDQEMALTHTEFKLLRELMEHSGEAMTREELMEQIMGSEINITARAIDVHLASLRKKMGDLSNLIETVRGVGYRFRK